MFNYTLKFLSKNKNFLNNDFFFFFFNKYLLKTVKSYYQKKTKSKKFSLLKSPHVNKTSQEQFKFEFWYKNLKIVDIKKTKLFLVIFKKFTKHLFANSHINLKLVTSDQTLKKLNYIDNLHLNAQLNLKHKRKFVNTQKMVLNLNKKKYKTLKNYLKFIDLYGESVLKKRFASSVGRAKN